jgi:carbon-monoxide dehydrogenase medium subunit
MIRQGAKMFHSPTVWEPEQLEIAWKLKQQYGANACFIAGGTLMQTQWQKGLDWPPHLISLEQVKVMQGWGKEKLADEETNIRLGALTTLDVIRNDHSFFYCFPILVEAVRNISAPAIRNKATIGGNITSRTGDTIPAFLVMDATLSMFDGKDIHHKSLWDWIKEEDPVSDSILISIYLSEKLVAYKDHYFYKKIGAREAFSPSIVTISGCCKLNSQKEVEHIRLAVGCSTAAPQRLVHCEQLVKGYALSNDLLKKVFQAIKEEFIAATDVFATANYKKTVAANIIVSEIARFDRSKGGI